MNSIFITGVDTDIGKTFVSLGLALKLQSEGKKIGYFKPFQSGAYKKEGKLIAPDLYEFGQYTDIKTKYSYLFEGEVSPHLATLLNNVDVDIKKVKNDLSEFSKNFDYTIIEGAGGLYCPAIKGKLFKDIIRELNQEAIVVTTPNLGRLNHLLMTLECAKINNIKVKGIIINKMPENKTLSQEHFIEELSLFSNIPVMGVIPEVKNISKENIINAFKSINL